MTSFESRIFGLTDDKSAEGCSNRNEYICNNSDDWITYKYADEDTLNSLVNTWGSGMSKLYNMNVRNSSKRKGELVAYLSVLPVSDVLFLAEIDLRKIY